MTAHADAVALLTGWQPDAAAVSGDDDADVQRRLRADFLDFLAAHADGVLRDCRAGHLTASALVVDPTRGRVLLTRHATVGRWLQLGGHIEPGDPSVAAAALREAREESGIAALTLSAAPVRLDRHAVRCSSGEQVTELDHLDVQFVAIAPPDAQEIAEGEAPLAWFGWDALPDEADPAVRALVAAAARGPDAG